MKFPHWMLMVGCFGTVMATGAIRAQDADVTVPDRAIAGPGATIHPLTLLMDGSGVGAGTEAVVLLPSTDSRRLSIELPTQMPPSGPAVRTDADQSVTLAMPLNARIVWNASAGIMVPRSLTRIDWVPPDGGLPATVIATVEVQRTDDQGNVLDPWTAQASARLLAGVRFDRDGSGLIGDTVIGIYPNEFANDAPAVVRRTAENYRPPTIFYRLDAKTQALPLSPRLTMGKLAPPVFDSETATRYVAIDPRLVRFWDALCEEVTSAGRNPGALKILRGFVSPNERQRLERLNVQLASFSRYQYGDAVAVIYDEHGDFRMDDLNGDGSTTIEDGEMLAGWARAAMAKANVSGGLGLESSFEGPNHIGTPYVHIDLRGGGVVEWRN